MHAKVIPLRPLDAQTRQRKRQQPRGRQVDPQARAEVLELVGAAAPRRDLLIEYLHAINDRYGQLSTAHLAALAQGCGSRRPRSSRWRASTTTSTWCARTRTAPRCTAGADRARLRRPLLRAGRRAGSAGKAARPAGRRSARAARALRRPLRAGAGRGRAPASGAACHDRGGGRLRCKRSGSRTSPSPASDLAAYRAARRLRAAAPVPGGQA